MNKKNRDDMPKIKITLVDEAPEPNPTLLALLRDGEKLKPGDPRGTLADRLGGEVQTFFADQIRTAKFVRRAVKGSVTLTIAVVTGPDGSQGYTVESKTKGAKISPGFSMTFTDEDGELTGRPIEPLTERMYENERAAGAKSAPAEPKAGARGSDL